MSVFSSSVSILERSYSRILAPTPESALDGRQETAAAAVDFRDSSPASILSAIRSGQM